VSQVILGINAEAVVNLHAIEQTQSSGMTSRRARGDE